MTQPATPNPKTARRRQPELVRKRILSAALTLFAARGFEGASLQQVATKAKVSLPLIIYHFKSKIKLWQAVIEHAVIEFDSLIDTATRNNPNASATDRLHDVIETTVRVSMKFPEFRRILANEAYTHTPRLEWIGKHFALRHYHFIISLIEQAQAEGSVVNIEPCRLSFLITAMATNPSNTAEYQYLTGRDPFSSEEVEATITAIKRVIFLDH